MQGNAAHEVGRGRIALDISLICDGAFMAIGFYLVVWLGMVKGNTYEWNVVAPNMVPTAAGFSALATITCVGSSYCRSMLCAPDVECVVRLQIHDCVLACVGAFDPAHHCTVRDGNTVQRTLHPSVAIASVTSAGNTPIQQKEPHR